MKRNLIIVMAALFIFTFAAPAFAAPIDTFADVPANHWAYDAVKKLAKARIVEGYGDGTFRGQSTITRYEMAIITANAMTKLDKANAEQKALIEKLAKEFDTELVKLGVRVAKLEANQPNIKMGGQARVTYAFRNDAVTNAVNGLNKDRDSYYTYRFRLEGTVKFNDKMTFFGRMRAQDYDIETGAVNSGKGSFSQVYVEQFWFSLRDPLELKGTTFTIGRQGLLLGKGGVVYAVGDKDVAMLDGGKPEFKWKVALKNDPATGSTNKREVYLQVGTKIGSTANLTAYNVRGVQSYQDQTDLYGVALDTKISDKLSLFGEYAKNNKYNGDDKIYWVGLTNGNPIFHPNLGFAASWMKPGANAQSLIYRYYGGDNTTFSAPFNIGESQLNAVLGNEKMAGVYWLQGTKGWEFYDQRCLEKNVMLLTQIGTAKDVKTGSRLSTYGVLQLYTFF